MKGRDFTVSLGLADHHRPQAAALYWAAFGPKLGRVMGPERKALGFIDRVMRSDHAITAVDANGALLGVAGFKSVDGAFVGGGFDDLSAVYGRAGALWRAALLHALERDVENERFLMDGICVSAAARGRGVGSALIEALCHEARWRGYEEVRLDVIVENLRARALYERLGFEVRRTVGIGPLRHAFGFSAATTMTRRI